MITAKCKKAKRQLSFVKQQLKKSIQRQHQAKENYGNKAKFLQGYIMVIVAMHLCTLATEFLLLKMKDYMKEEEIETLRKERDATVVELEKAKGKLESMKTELDKKEELLEFNIAIARCELDLYKSK